MLRNYLLIAFRNLWHDNVYALINIVGLAIGLTASFFIFQFAQFENSYDNFHANADNIYRLIYQVNREVIDPPEHRMFSNVAPALKREIPEIVEYTSLYFEEETHNYAFSSHNKDSNEPNVFLVEKVFYADASFMPMFSFPMITGNPASCLREPNSVIVSERLAAKLFGNTWPGEDPTGRLVTINGTDEYMVTGVFKNIPENSHIKFEALLSLTTLKETLHYDTEWFYPFRVYFELDPNSNPDDVVAKIVQWEDKHMRVMFEKYNYHSSTVSLQPLKDVHLHSMGFDAETEVRGSYATVKFLWTAGIFILALAWVNYVNLSTARAVKRSREVGVRKVVGAARGQLIIQFLLEACLINLLSLIVSIMLYQLLFPVFANLVQKRIPVDSLLQTPWLLGGIALMLLSGTLLSGGYAAFVLSSLKAVNMIKGRFYGSSKGVLLRKCMIVFQFAVSVALIIGTITLYRQLQFMKNNEKGFDMTQKLMVRAPVITNEYYGQHYEKFKNSLMDLPYVSQVSASGVSPGDLRKGPSILNRKKPENEMWMPVNSIDYEYFDSYKITILHGRKFSRDFSSDKDAVLISERGALQLGFNPTETALHQKIVLDPQWVDKEVEIIGIVRDLSLYSLHLEQTGVIFQLGIYEGEITPHWPFRHFTIELATSENLKDQIEYVEALYNKSFPGNPFDYFFLDDYFNAQYHTEEQFGKIFTTASGLAIFIACLGLFGLSTFMVEQRAKEISIRKVLGASLQNILVLLTHDYVRLVFIAALLALPFAYKILTLWLESYMYQVGLTWWSFIIPVVLVLSVALLTVSVETARAAITNPAETLQRE